MEVNKFRLPYEMPVRKTAVRRNGTYDLAHAEEILERLHGSPVESPHIAVCFGGARTGESADVWPEEVKLESHGSMLAVVPIVRRTEKTGDALMPDDDLKNPQSVRTTVIPKPYSTLYYELAQQRPPSASSGWPTGATTCR